MEGRRYANCADCRCSRTGGCVAEKCNADTHRKVIHLRSSEARNGIFAGFHKKVGRCRVVWPRGVRHVESKHSEPSVLKPKVRDYMAQTQHPVEVVKQ